MKMITQLAHLKQVVDRNMRGNKQVGFVPTMGYLHEGHLALVQQAKKETDIVVMSIFVNPTQFGPQEDFEAYPRDQERDIRLAQEAGVDVLLLPTVEEMYPQLSDIQIVPGRLANTLCGVSRPHHFDGVLQVILKFFNLVEPDVAYFGMKDAQQLAIIENFVAAFNCRTKIRRVPTVREPDGLAKSSRNIRLTPREREEAPAIYQALLAGRKLFQTGHPSREIEMDVWKRLTASCSGKVDYVQCVTFPSLTQWNGSSGDVLLACAVQFSTVRLIDNVFMTTKERTYVSNDVK